VRHKVPQNVFVYFHHMFLRREPLLLKKMSCGTKKKKIQKQLFSDLHHALRDDARDSSINSPPSVNVSLDTVAKINLLRAENKMLIARLAEQSNLSELPQTSSEVLLHSLLASRREANLAIRRQAEILALVRKQQQTTALLSLLHNPGWAST